jgi:putative membrane protein
MYTFIPRTVIIRLATLTAAASLALPAAGLAQQQQAKADKLDDPTIVAIFDAANTWDVQTGSLAEKKASSKDVRDFGHMIARDHNMVRQQGRDLAKKLGVTPTAPKNFGMVKDHEAAMKKLEGLHGKEFDKAFLEHEVAFHKAVIDAVNTTLLPSLQNQEVKDLVIKVAPAFKAHEDAAQHLLDAQK